MNVNQFNLKFTTDLDKGITLTPLNQAFLQDDHKAHVFTIKTTRGGAANSLENTTIKGFFLPSAADSVAIELDGERNTDGEAVITLTQDCYAYAGRFYFIVQAIADGMKSSIFYAEGYVSKTRTDSVIEPSGAVPSLSALEERINNLTYADVGAAPAGYGLGAAQLVTADIDNITTPGWYYWNTATTIADITANYWFMHVSAYGSGGAHCVQRLYPCINTSGFIELIRRKFASDWEPVEFVNPPMLPGVEYRTTERWNGKPVYVKMVNFGNLPNNSVKVVNALTESVNPISFHGVATFNNGYHYDFPIANDSSGANMAWAYMYNGSASAVCVRTNGDLSGATAYFVVKYTKN